MAGVVRISRAADKISSEAIRQAMAKTFAAPEWAIMWEVSNATGAVGSRRYADAVMMSLWPSRGLELHGVEIKISRSDWKREALAPQKAEAIGAYCDRWWVHTCPSVIDDVTELPPLWGWREWTGSKWLTRKNAELNPAPRPIDRTFLAALLRRADEIDRARVEAGIAGAVQKANEQIAATVEDEVNRRTQHNLKAIKIIEAFKTASGIDLTSWGNPPAEIGALVKAIQNSGIANSWNGLRGIHKRLADIVSRLAEVSEDPILAAIPELQDNG